MKESIKEIIRFGIVGLGNTILGLIVMFVLYDSFNVGYWISSAVAYVIGGFFSFFANKLFTFKVRSVGDTGIRLLKFIFNLIVCYLLAYAIAKPLVKQVVLSYFDEGNIDSDRIALLVGMCFYTGFNYIGQKLLVFSKKNVE
ncbi:MAG: GtrA family protein [Lachnospiraceae bacterium]|nr:GtrA family protein [Lachnospiraceae bacterium]